MSFDVRRHYALVHSKLIIVALAFLIAGCSSVGTHTTGIWYASEDNGDKPGIGIELVRTASGIHGSMYLLDPNKPHDFAAGSRRRMEIHSASDREVRFAVQWLPTQRDEMVLRLSSPLASQSVHGVLQSVDGQDEPRAYEFARTR